MPNPQMLLSLRYTFAVLLFGLLFTPISSRHYLNSDRRFHTHTQSYNSASFEDGDAADEARSSLLKKFSGNFSVFQAEISDWGRYDWMDDLDNQMLIRFVQQLPAQDIELLTFLIVDGLNQSDIARIRNVSSPAISKQKARIRKNLEKFLGDG